jgi:hypothetical protein
MMFARKIYFCITAFLRLHDFINGPFSSFNMPALLFSQQWLLDQYCIDTVSLNGEFPNGPKTPREFFDIFNLFPRAMFHSVPDLGRGAKVQLPQVSTSKWAPTQVLGLVD